MNVKLLVVLYLVILAITSVYLPEYVQQLLAVQDVILDIVEKSSTALITKGS